jgi:hypothetical protein
MAEQSHREEMAAAIRAQRARHNVPRTIAPEPVARPEPREEPEQETRRSLLGRLRRRAT